MNINEIKRHSFQPGAMSIIQMGEELIGHPTTAINELVKNGYDADATEARVYVNVDDIRSFALVFDNGLGMNYTTLFGDWLKPSSSAKRAAGAKSEIFERSFLGNKGIGRLAAMALGKVLTVVSKKMDEKSYNWLSLNSDMFRSDELLSKINFPGDRIDNFETLFSDQEFLELRGAKKNPLLNNLISTEIKKFKEGTLIVIEDVDDSLITIFKKDFEQDTENEITLRDTTFYRSLSVLITPLELTSAIQTELLQKEIISSTKKIAKDQSTFSIHYGTNLISEEGKIEFIKVHPISVLEQYDYRVIGKVDKLGNVFGKYTCQRIKEISYTEDFTISNDEIFDDEFKRLKNIHEVDELKLREWNRDAGEFYFDVRIYDRGEEDSREKLYNLIQGNTVNQKKQILDGLLGLRISKNGFGVKPYGEEAKDWLNLGQLRVQNPGQNVSTNQILGYILFYSPENDSLKEKTNREGFFENKAFIDCKHILQVIFKNIGRLRYNFRLKYNLGRVPHNRLNRPDAQAFIDFLKNESDQDSILKRSEDFVKEVTTALDNMEDTLSFSQRLASLGTGLELIYHELAQPIAKIGGARAILNKKINKISDIDTRELFIKEISHIGSYVSQLDELKSSIKPAIGKSRPQLFKPNHTFKKVCHLFKKDFEEENIELLIHAKSENYEIEDMEYALWISFLNIVNNAVYWLKLNREKQKFISFFIEDANKMVILNNGPYIPNDYVDLVFEYGFTLKKEKNATGLGLAFTKNILNLNNWDISAENRQDGPAFIIQKK
jgi:signal transduction histidine kinase